MKALRISEDMECRYEDAVFCANGAFHMIVGSAEQGFEVNRVIDIGQLLEEQPIGWTTMITTIEAESDGLIGATGETSYGGAGYITLRNKETSEPKWAIHLSNMNNPKAIRFESVYLIVETDLNFPNGLAFKIPIERPWDFEIEKLKGR
jgi:hypothetical protein